MEQQIENKENIRKKGTKEIEDLQITIEKYKKGLENIYKEIATLEGHIASRKESFKKYAFADYQSKAHALVEKEYEEVVRSNKQTEQAYTSLTEERNRLLPLLSQYEAQLKGTCELLEKWEKELSDVEHTLESTLSQEHISLEEVSQILCTPIAIEENRKKYKTLRFATRFSVSKLKN